MGKGYRLGQSMLGSSGGGAGSVLFFEVAAVTQVCSLCKISLNWLLKTCVPHNVRIIFQ